MSHAHTPSSKRDRTAHPVSVWFVFLVWGVAMVLLCMFSVIVLSVMR